MLGNEVKGLSLYEQKYKTLCISAFFVTDNSKKQYKTTKKKSKTIGRPALCIFLATVNETTPKKIQNKKNLFWRHVFLSAVVSRSCNRNTKQPLRSRDNYYICHHDNYDLIQIIIMIKDYDYDS